MGSSATEDVHSLEGVDDVASFVADLMRMEPQMLEREEPHLLQRFKFPNTYTFTKRLSELNMHNRRGNLRLSISRPAIVTCCDKYPFPGWSDSIAAGGSLAFSMGMQFSNLQYFYPGLVSSIIPCDYVVNAIMLASAVSALPRDPEFFVVHVCSSGAQKKSTLHSFFTSANEYLKY